MFVDLSARANLRNDDIKALHLKKIRRPPTLADLCSFRPFNGFEFCRSKGSAFSFSSFSRSRPRVAASHRLK